MVFYFGSGRYVSAWYCMEMVWRGLFGVCGNWDRDRDMD